MKVEVLVSSMNQKDYSLISKMRISTDAVVVNQCQEDSVSEFDINGCHIKWINSTTKGISISRNICLRNASGDICLLADDDLEYVDGYSDIVLNAFEKYPGASIIRFKVTGIEKKFKSYPKKIEKVGFFKSLKVSSVEIALLRKSVKGLLFDELIGAGKNFCMGEENAFLAHCFKKGLKMFYLPQVISYLHIGESSWKNISAERYLLSRGAAFEAMETIFTHFLIFQFAIRRRKKYKDSFSLINAVKLMEKGRQEYLKCKRDKDLGLV